jgi:hypothetical protein
MDYETPAASKPASTSIERFRVVPGNRGSARGEVLDRFVEKLNPAREASGYRPYTVQQMAVLLSHVPTDDLHPFYKQCEQSGIPFGAYFHWSLKTSA